MQEHVALAGLAPPHCQGPSNASAHIPTARGEGLPGSAPAQAQLQGGGLNTDVSLYGQTSPASKPERVPSLPALVVRDWFLLPGLNRAPFIFREPSASCLWWEEDKGSWRAQESTTEPVVTNLLVCWALLPLSREVLGLP